MNFSSRSRLRLALAATFMGGMTITSCAPSNFASSELLPAPNAMPQDSVTQSAGSPASADVATLEAVTTVPRSQPQMVKTAQVSLTVDSIEKSIETVRSLAQQQQGDILGLEDQIPYDDGSYHTASLQIRVPQDKLDATLAALSELGTMQRQSIAAEDVSNQLVDFQARLRNLRKTEEMLLSIMERSGGVGDVLKVAQELSNVRNSIEQIDAQLSDLQNRVAYSTISVSLEEAIAATIPQRAVTTQLKEAWDGSTHSLGTLTVNLLQLGIWLLVYSPYWLIAIAAVCGYNRYRRHPSRTSAAQPEPPASN